MLNTHYEVKNGLVCIPKKEYEELMERLEELEDIAVLDGALANPEETYPAEMVEALINGENPVKIYRKYRGLSQNALAQIVGMSKTTISEIETGRKQGSIRTLKKLACALKVDLDDLT